MLDNPVPILTHFLRALASLLDKAERHCQARKIEPDAILQARLYPDMFPLARQVMLATDFAKGMAARLSGEAVPSFPDVEKSFAELQARIAKTITFAEAIEAARFTGAGNRNVTVRVAGQEQSFTGDAYLYNYALPNFYFHLTTAYNILRHNGLDIGKADFTGRS